MPAADIPNDLTDRQKDVLRLTREGKNPTEIGSELGITSQGVHSHLRRLRKRGLVPALDAPKPAAASRPRAGGERVSPSAAIEAVLAAVREQENAINARREAIATEIKDLEAEDIELAGALDELARFGREDASGDSASSESAAA